MRRAFALCVLTVMFVPSLAQALPAPDKLPADVLAFSEMGNVISLDGKIAGLARAVDPSAQAPPLAAMMPMHFMKTMDASSVDLTKPVHQVLLAFQKPSGVLIFSVPDAKRYMDSVWLPPKGPKGDLRVYEEPPMFGPQQQGAKGKTVVIGAEGNRVVVGSDEAAVTKALALVKGGTFGAEALFQGADVGALARPNKLLANLDAQSMNPFQMTRGMIMMSAARTDPQSAAVVGQGLDALESLLRQTDVAGAEVALGTDAILVNAVVKGMPGSAVARYADSIGSGQTELLDRLPEGGSILFAGKTGDLTGLIDWYTGILENLPGIGGSPEAAGRLAEAARKMNALTAGEIAASYGLGSDGISALSVTKAKDAAAAKELMGPLAALVSDTLAVQQASGVKVNMNYTPNAATHAGVAIDEWTISYEFGQALTEQQQAAAKAMEEAMWGGPMTGCLAAVDDNVLYAQGKDSLNALKAAIDGPEPSAKGSARLAAALKGMPADPSMMGYVVVEDLAAFVVQLVSTVAAAADQLLPPAVSAFQLPPGEPVGFAVWARGSGQLDGSMRVPMAMIKNVSDAVHKAEAAGQEPMEYEPLTE